MQCYATKRSASASRLHRRVVVWDRSPNRARRRYEVRRKTVASPFAGAVKVSGPGAADKRPPILQGLSLQDTRRVAAIEAVPGYACSVDAQWRLADGTVKDGAAHGFATPRKAGEPCPTTTGKCEGTIR